MARFRFALQRVLDLRLDEEEVKRRALASIERRRRDLEESLRTRQAEILAARSAWRGELTGEIDPATLRHHATAGIGILRKAQRTVLEIASLEKGIAKARAEAVDAARARRALELLRERRLAAFNELESRREQASLDEFGAFAARSGNEQGTAP
jgi:flagellar FliJ protein